MPAGPSLTDQDLQEPDGIRPLLYRGQEAEYIFPFAVKGESDSPESRKRRRDYEGHREVRPKILTEDEIERRDQLLSDPTAVIVHPARMTCTRCKAYIVLTRGMKYDLAKWKRHVERCKKLNDKTLNQRIKRNEQRMKNHTGTSYIPPATSTPPLTPDASAAATTTTSASSSPGPAWDVDMDDAKFSDVVVGAITPSRHRASDSDEDGPPLKRLRLACVDASAAFMAAAYPDVRPFDMNAPVEKVPVGPKVFARLRTPLHLRQAAAGREGLEQPQIAVLACESDAETMMMDTDGKQPWMCLVDADWTDDESSSDDEVDELLGDI